MSPFLLVGKHMYTYDQISVASFLGRGLRQYGTDEFLRRTLDLTHPSRVEGQLQGSVLDVLVADYNNRQARVRAEVLGQSSDQKSRTNLLTSLRSMLLPGEVMYGLLSHHQQYLFMSVEGAIVPSKGQVIEFLTQRFKASRQRTEAAWSALVAGTESEHREQVFWEHTCDTIEKDLKRYTTHGDIVPLPASTLSLPDDERISIEQLRARKMFGDAFWLSILAEPDEPVTSTHQPQTVQ